MRAYGTLGHRPTGTCSTDRERSAPAQSRHLGVRRIAKRSYYAPSADVPKRVRSDRPLVKAPEHVTDALAEALTPLAAFEGAHDALIESGHPRARARKRFTSAERYWPARCPKPAESQDGCVFGTHTHTAMDREHSSIRGQRELSV